MPFEIATAFVPPPITAPDGANGFERHGINHLSASSINLWTNAPDVWVARYLLKAHTPFGPAAERGKKIEDAVVATLCGEDMSTAIKAAIEAFVRVCGDGADAATQRELIGPMTEQAVDALRDLGCPEFGGDGQDKISINAVCEGFTIPVWGFLDLVYPEHGTVVDLKTTTRVPTVMSADHQLQRAIYHRAKGNHAVRFLYVSAKKAEWREDGAPAEILARAKVQITRMERFLRQHDAETARQCVPVNPSSFYWSGASALCREIYGL